MKSLALAIVTGAIAAIAVFGSFTFQLATWAMFIAWVSYYIFGKNPGAAALVLVQMVLGFLIGILIQESTGALGGALGRAALPVAVFVFIGLLSYASKLKVLNNIAAYFLGMIIFFAAHPPLEASALFGLGLAVVLGFLFAWTHDQASQVVERSLG